MRNDEAGQGKGPTLARQVSFPSALTLNMMYMIGVGPFITMPLVIMAMGGPQSLLGWVLGAFIAICDGLVWAELGAMMPRAGGSYAFLREIYGPERAGRLASFLYVWQAGFSVPMSAATGCIGLAQYAAYLWPSLGRSIFPASRNFILHGIRFTGLVAAGACFLMVVLLYRDVRSITRLAWVLWAGVIATIGAIIFAAATHFHLSLLVALPPGAFHLGTGFFTGLGAATLITIYDYWGYYNVCFMGSEIRDPGRNIPRAVILSILIVAALYLAMNIGVLGVLPWQELVSATSSSSKLAAVSLLMQRTFGPAAAQIITLLIMWTAFASAFTLLFSYSRVPYAAALDGNFFRVFGRLHPRHNFPHISLVALGTVSIFFCFFDLAHVIAAFVTMRIVIQFLLQQVGVVLLRKRQPERPRPFRMWLYPLPPVLAVAGFLFVLFSRPNASRELMYAAIVAGSGCLVYFIRARIRGEWPFTSIETR